MDLFEFFGRVTCIHSSGVGYKSRDWDEFTIFMLFNEMIVRIIFELIVLLPDLATTIRHLFLD